MRMYVLAIVVLLALLVARRDRRVLLGVAGVALAAVLVQFGWSSIAAEIGRTTFTTPGGGAPVSTGGLWDSAGMSLAYIWQIFLPPLPFMYDHYPTHDLPAYTIYVKRAWASFGWYSIEWHPPSTWRSSRASARPPLSGLAFARRGRLVKRELGRRRDARAHAGDRDPRRRARLRHSRRRASSSPRWAATCSPRPAPWRSSRPGAFWAFGERWAARITSGVVVALMVFTFASQLLLLRGFYT